MESAQLHRPHGGVEEQPPQRGGGLVRSTVMEEEEQRGPGQDYDEHHHEKKSVLKKVKAKAKKIKNTLTHHGHGHEHEHDRDDEESLEDDDDEMEEDPDVHGGHFGGDGGGAVTSTVIYHKVVDDSSRPLENPSANPTYPDKDYHGSGLKDRGVFRRGEEDDTRQTTGGISRVQPLHNRPPPFVSETHHQTSGHGRGDFLQPGGLEEDPHAPSDRPRPPSNYESKTFDPTGAGGEEARISPLVQSFEKMEVRGDEAKPQQNIRPQAGTHHKLYTGSHDQFAPEPMATNVYTSSKDTESIPKSFDPTNPENLPRDPIDGKPQQEGSYAGKMQGEHEAASPVDYAKTAAMAVAEKLAPVYDRVAGAGSAVMEKLPIGASGERGKGEVEGEGKSVTSTVKEKLAPFYDKVAGAGSTLMSKVKGPGTGQAVVVEGYEEGNDVRTDKGVSIKEFLAEKLKPGEEDKALSDMISGTLLSRQKEETVVEGKPVGKVTESEEVARRLGRIGDSPREGSEEKGMVDMLKGAVNSWLGRDSQPQTTDTTNVRNEEVGHQSAVGERRLEHQDAMAEGRSRLQESGH
ncbi:PREDICTED: low-temperature-induced 65 kDa protein-like [Ipomoea nil]|uniref:low-temperature-induced 65 kDa protein-like n=1 Tax=Ipomoea nil TaxID=35883 RepID=UPI0009017CBA|nr:PREDICTED: low-temperature-induced 65 kDa protein-like [Ipomoea nil]